MAADDRDRFGGGGTCDGREFAVGMEARVDLEAAFGTKVFLDLRVKVNPDWRDNDRALDDIGVPRSARRERKPRS